MSINIKKDDIINLEKLAKEIGIPVLDSLTVGLSWDASDISPDIDVDSVVIICGADGRALKSNNGEDGILFYNNRVLPGLFQTADNRTGKGDGYDETIHIELSKLNPRVQKLVIAATINDADVKKQNFGNIENASIEIKDAITNTTLLSYNLTDDYGCETGLIVGTFYQVNGIWEFRALCLPINNGLLGLCNQFDIDAE